MLDHQALQLGGSGAVFAEGEAGLDAIFDGRQPELGELDHLLPQRGCFVGHVDQRRAVPQCQGFDELFSRLRRVLLERPTRLMDQALEDPGVDLGRIHLQHVSRSPSDEQLSLSVDGLAQVGYVAL